MKPLFSDLRDMDFLLVRLSGVALITLSSIKLGGNGLSPILFGHLTCSEVRREDPRILACRPAIGFISLGGCAGGRRLRTIEVGLRFGDSASSDVLDGDHEGLFGEMNVWNFLEYTRSLDEYMARAVHHDLADRVVEY